MNVLHIKELSRLLEFCEIKDRVNQSAALELRALLHDIADAFYTVVSNRIYYKGKIYEVERAELKAHAGLQFDSEVVAAFERNLPEE